MAEEKNKKVAVRHSAVLTLCGVAPNPLNSPVTDLNWSTNCSSRRTVTGRRRKRPNNVPKASEMLDVSAWSVEDVVAWLKEKGFGKFEEHFRREEIDGVALVMITTADKENVREALGIKTLGDWKRFLSGVQDLRRRNKPAARPGDEDDTEEADDMTQGSFSFRLRANHVCMYLKRCCYEQKRIPRLVVTAYTKRKTRNNVFGRNRDQQDNVPRPSDGVPYLQVEIYNALVVQEQAYGGRSESVPVISFYFKFDRMTTHMNLLRLHNAALSQEDMERQLRVGAAELLDPNILELFQSHAEYDKAIVGGSTVDYDLLHGTVKSYRWSDLSWSPVTHRFYPRKFQRAVLAMLLCHKHAPDHNWRAVSKEVLHRVLYYAGFQHASEVTGLLPYPLRKYDPNAVDNNAN